MIINPYLFGAPPAWRTIFDWTASTVGSNSGWSGYTLRHRVLAAALGGAGTSLRVTCKANLGGTLTKSYVQIGPASGDVYDFDTTPVALTWDTGNAGYTVGNNTNKLSDEITLSLDGTRDLVFSFYFSAMSNLYTQAGEPGRTNLTAHYKLGDDATTVDATGYTSTVATFVQKLEIFG